MGERQAHGGSLAWPPVSAAGHARFPPIGSYGFLSDCHTSALVSYDGAVEWLCLPRFDSPSAFAALLDRGAGHFKLAPRGVIVPISRRYEPGTLVIETTWVTDTGWVVVHDLLSIGEWAPERRQGRPAPRPNTSPTTRCCGLMTCLDGEVEMEMECMPRFAYGAEAGDWSGGELGEAVPLGEDGTELRLTSDMELTIATTAPPAARMRLREDETGFCAVTWGEGDLGGPRSAPEALERLDSTEEFWRQLAARRRLPRPSLAHPPAALGPRPQGPHLHADRGDRRRADHLAAGDPRRRTQLGLPLQLDPRLDLQPLGPAHARLRPGGARLHALHPRRLPRGPRPADHVRDRRREGPRPRGRSTTSAATAAPARCGSATAPTTSASTTSGAPCSTRSTCTKRPCEAPARRPTAN